MLGEVAAQALTDRRDVIDRLMAAPDMRDKPNAFRDTMLAMYNSQTLSTLRQLIAEAAPDAQRPQPREPEDPPRPDERLPTRPEERRRPLDRRQPEERRHSDRKSSSKGDSKKRSR